MVFFFFLWGGGGGDFNFCMFFCFVFVWVLFGGVLWSRLEFCGSFLSVFDVWTACSPKMNLNIDYAPLFVRIIFGVLCLGQIRQFVDTITTCQCTAKVPPPTKHSAKDATASNACCVHCRANHEHYWQWPSRLYNFIAMHFGGSDLHVRVTSKAHCPSEHRKSLQNTRPWEGNLPKRIQKVPFSFACSNCSTAFASFLATHTSQFKAFPRAKTKAGVINKSFPGGSFLNLGHFEIITFPVTTASDRGSCICARLKSPLCSPFEIRIQVRRLPWPQALENGCMPSSAAACVIDGEALQLWDPIGLHVTSWEENLAAFLLEARLGEIFETNISGDTGNLTGMKHVRGHSGQNLETSVCCLTYKNQKYSRKIS